MRTFTDAHRDWLTVVRLPACAPDLNPAEGVWANMMNGLGNLAARDVGQLAAVLRNRLKSIQYRPGLIGGFLAQAGLTLEPPAALAPMPFHEARAGFRSGVGGAASHGPTQAFAARPKRSRSVETLPVRVPQDAHDLRRDGRRARTARAARVGVRTGSAAQELLSVGLVR